VTFHVTVRPRQLAKFNSRSGVFVLALVSCSAEVDGK
jgi:hypothetical protein